MCIPVSLSLINALENTSKTFEDIGKLYAEEVMLNHLTCFCLIYNMSKLINNKFASAKTSRQSRSVVRISVKAR